MYNFYGEYYCEFIAHGLIFDSIIYYGLELLLKCIILLLIQPAGCNVLYLPK
jgi:hypothetical protein